MQERVDKRNPKIVVVGGGTGVFTVLSGLRKYPVELSAIVSMADDGGSTGVLREEFGILPPGDVRRVLVAMSHSERLLSDLFNYRFEEGGLRGHTFGNIMLTALERLTGSFEEAVDEAAKILRVKGRVFPVTLDNVRLCAELEDGTLVRGETNIDIPRHDGFLKIARIWLEPEAKLNTKAESAIKNADMIIVGPGDLYTSIVPNLLVRGMPEALKNSSSKKVYVVNLMTKWGETNGFTAADFLSTLEKYLGKNVLNCIVINNKRPSLVRTKQYEKENAKFIEAGNLPSKPVPVFGDYLRSRGFVRHDPDKLAKILVSLI